MLKIAWNALYTHPLPVGHRFPMAKYELLPEQLLYEGTITQDNLFSPDSASTQDVLRAHCPAYLQKLTTGTLSRQEERQMGFPYSAGLVQRELIIARGTIDAALFALQYGVAMNIAGGTHHAFSDRGEGFCLLNDIAIAALYLLEHQLATRILVVDLDVHQGNGTAEIFAREPRVYTFSMHGKKNYPLRKERSDLDIALDDGTGDKHYMKALHNALPKLFDEIMPQFVFYLSGVDVLASDKLGRLGMSLSGCRARDQYVLMQCRKHNVPVAVSMGGGYSERIADIVEAHANTYRLAQELYF